ncbi:MAG: hypothetical protein CMA63_00695 [Euryarchaeota archaeon]|nr:hypothetical protein [Euryarchaeota archaeon]|tara:strand:+ start:7489 stop:7740 length:252 start_codon:yes stop_codon:yes gene_type:complete
MSETFWSKITSNEVFQSFMLFSIFRAFYGTGILVITYFLSTSADAPWYVSVGFLLASMVFSRVLFRGIKRWRSEDDPVNGASF